MSEPQDFQEMANKREDEAAVLSDEEIYRTMIEKFIGLGLPPDMLAGMIFDTIADHEFIFKEMASLAESGQISEDDANIVIETIKNRLQDS